MRSQRLTSKNEGQLCVEIGDNLIQAWERYSTADALRRGARTQSRLPLTWFGIMSPMHKGNSTLRYTLLERSFFTVPN